MRILDPQETERLLPYGALADACAGVLRAKRAGTAQAPQRLHLDLPGGGVLLAMPAADRDLAITKLATVHPGNTELPTIQAEVLVMDAQSGERLGILDGPTVTARRTAAISLLAARTLAPKAGGGPGALLVVGAGVQARGHLEAFREGLAVEEAFVCSRSMESARRLADHARGLGMRATAVASPADALGEVSLIVTATTSRSPVLPADVLERVRAGLFVSAVGAFRPDMAELPEALVRSGRLYADMAEAALHESGDLKGRVGPEAVTSLEDVLDGPRPEPDPRPVVFECVGHALFDLAAARLAFAV